MVIDRVTDSQKDQRSHPNKRFFSLPEPEDNIIKGEVHHFTLPEITTDQI